MRMTSGTALTCVATTMNSANLIARTSARTSARASDRTSLRRHASAGIIALGCVLITISTPLHAQQLLTRDLLVQMSRSQSTQLCGFKAFTECMEFTEKECLALSEEAIKQCLLPLPEKINPSELENDSIEACPRQVYEDAGYGDDKAKACLLEATK